MGKIFCIIGKSATGKDHIYQDLLSRESLDLKTITLYTTRPKRQYEENGKEYYFVDISRLEEFRRKGCLIECRQYHTIQGEWNYFTVDDGSVQLDRENYLVIGTLESFLDMVRYYGREAVVPLYVFVEDGERLTRALSREKKQLNPQYEEMCRRFLADQADFSDEKVRGAGISRWFENRELTACTEEIAVYISSLL